VYLIDTDFERGKDGGVLSGIAEDNLLTYDKDEGIGLDKGKLLSRSLMV
jgi:hypothetical protein